MCGGRVATGGGVAVVFQIMPSLGWIGAILGLCRFYRLYLGLPILMKAPAAKAMAYTLATIVAAIVLFFVIGAITAALTTRIIPPSVPTLGSIGGAAGGTVTVPGGGTLDLGKLDAAAKKREETTKQMQSGEVQPHPRDAPPALLPPRTAGTN